MYLGRIVETGRVQQLYELPRHPYTRALLSALPVADPDLADSQSGIVLTGDVPSPVFPPSGCRFHTRCPRAEQDCVQSEPVLAPVLDDLPDHETACHHPLAVGELLSDSQPSIADTQIQNRTDSGRKSR
ncbi:MAG: ABC transporter ATP-binding protein [Nocardioides sp.]|nr:ABC transporter ATP-binding protein [Nocardioides sp.]